MTTIHQINEQTSLRLDQLTCISGHDKGRCAEQVQQQVPLQMPIAYINIY